jgi:exodeoxyribonuclease-3
MRVITLNVNGIRAAARKGFFDWLGAQQADLVCLQETRARETQLKDPAFRPAGYHCFYREAERPGYSGVAVYSRVQPETVIHGLGWPELDSEGRYLELRFGAFAVVSLYLPSGSSSEARQAFKMALLERFMGYLQDLRDSGREYLLCGDWNIAHKTIDLKNWRGNQKNSGFLPDERAWMDRLFGESGFVDAFRRVNPNPDQYTWWSNRGRAWEKNVGWRIDYQVATPGLGELARSASVYKEQRFSDHAPLTMDYRFELD